MNIGCVNSVVNHNFTLTRAHLLLQCYNSLCTYMDIFTTDYQCCTALSLSLSLSLHTAELVVVETLWQLHTLTVTNSWLHTFVPMFCLPTVHVCV